MARLSRRMGMFCARRGLRKLAFFAGCPGRVSDDKRAGGSASTVEWSGVAPSRRKTRGRAPQLGIIISTPVRYTGPPVSRLKRATTQKVYRVERHPAIRVGGGKEPRHRQQLFPRPTSRFRQKDFSSFRGHGGGGGLRKAVAEIPAAPPMPPPAQTPQNKNHSLGSVPKTPSGVRVPRRSNKRTTRRT